MPRYLPIDGNQPLSECSGYSGPISSALHDNQNIEAEFCDFYAIILQKLHQKFQTEYELIRKALYSRTYGEPETRFAYVFSFSIIHSVLVYDRFRDMMKKRPSMLRNIFSKSELNICLLGGGPGFEAAAICKFLEKAIRVFKRDEGSQLLIHVTVVDMCAEWETVVKCLFTTLQHDLHPLIKVDFCFLHADLAEELPRTVVQKIKSSYILFMFEFLSEVLDTHGSGKVKKMIKGIVDVMSPESCLFLLDDAGRISFGNFEEIINNTPGTRTFYGPELLHCQELNEDTIEKYSFYLQDIFQTLKCSAKTTMACSAWLKVNQFKKINSQFSYSRIYSCERKVVSSCKKEGDGKQDINSSNQRSTDVKNYQEKKKKVMNSCKEEDSGKQDINSSILRSTDVKKNQEMKKKVMETCKGGGRGEQDINSLLQNCTDVRNNQKRKEKVTNSCEEKGSVKEDTSSSIPKSTDVKDIEKKVMKSCKQEKDNVEQDIKSSSSSKNSGIKIKQKKEKKAKEIQRGLRCISLNQRLENIESRFMILKP